MELFGRSPGPFQGNISEAFVQRDSTLRTGEHPRAGSIMEQFTSLHEFHTGDNRFACNLDAVAVAEHEFAAAVLMRAKTKKLGIAGARPNRPGLIPTIENQEVLCPTRAITIRINVSCIQLQSF
jgi:hypothetical protein